MIVGALLLVSVVGAGAYYAGTQQAASTVVVTDTQIIQYPEESAELESVACTMEAKVCPDGSSVGRTGPNCEFSMCPGETEQTAAQNTYTNTTFHYTFSYPQSWKVTTDNYAEPATSTSEDVYVFNPADNPSEMAFSGISISYQGMVQDFTNMTQTTVNGMPMYKQETMHGENYYANIPDTDQFLYITGTGGYTDSEERNTILREIFASFQFTSFMAPMTPSL